MSGFPDYSGYLHVAAAVIVDGTGHVLISRRHDHLHQGGLWEFPGGKVEDGETVNTALSRELTEELGIQVRSARPLIRIPYEYPERRVLLDVWYVDGFEGEARGMEGQPIRWIAPEELRHFEFPEANRPIVTAAQLPPLYLITPEPGSADGWPAFLQHLRSVIQQGIRLVQLRSKLLQLPELVSLAHQTAEVCGESGAKLLVNTYPEAMQHMPLEVGLHLNSYELHRFNHRPIGDDRWLASSCHSFADLQQAKKIAADFVVVSPVNTTVSHPDATPIGWNGLRQFTERSPIPVFALGGLGVADQAKSWAFGAQGVAAIRGLWDGI